MFSQISEGRPRKARVKKGSFQPWLLTQVDQSWHHEPCVQSACDSEIASSSSPAFEASNYTKDLDLKLLQKWAS